MNHGVNFPELEAELSAICCSRPTEAICNCHSSANLSVYSRVLRRIDVGKASQSSV